MLECKNCQDRWRIVLANQLNTLDMKDSKSKDTTEEVVVESQTSNKVNVDKIIEDRRKVLLEGKTVKK